MREGMKRSEIRVPADTFETFMLKCVESQCDMNPAIVAFMRAVNRGELSLRSPTSVEVVVADRAGAEVSKSESPPNHRTKRRALIAAGKRPGK